MGTMRAFCPHCGKIIPAGKRCTCRPKAKRRPTRADATRSEREPWRAAYRDPAYQRARQAVIERQRGRCADCEKICAWKKDGRWYTAGCGGEVDHEVALCDGGSNDASNLALRCRSCHAKRDAARRRASGR